MLRGVVIGLIGAVLLAVGIAAALAKRSFVVNASKAGGVVARLNAGGSHPEIEFAAATGEKYSYPQGGFIFGYKPGQHVTVLYDPSRPANSACVDAFGALWFTPFFLTAMGLFFVVVGFLSASDKSR